MSRRSKNQRRLERQRRRPMQRKQALQLPALQCGRILKSQHLKR